MPKMDWDQYDEASDYAPIPEGEYLVEIEEIKERTTNAGDEMWGLKLAIVEGGHQGRYIFDNMVFNFNSPPAMNRIKLICSRLGINTQGEMDLQPRMLEKRQAFVDTEHEEYENSEGKMKTKSSVKFAGWRRVDNDSASAETEEDDDGLPF